MSLPPSHPRERVDAPGSIQIATVVVDLHHLGDIAQRLSDAIRFGASALDRADVRAIQSVASSGLEALNRALAQVDSDAARNCAASQAQRSSLIETLQIKAACP